MEKIQVNILMHKNTAYLVQYPTGKNILNRVIVPALAVEMKNDKQGYVTAEDLEMGIPYGVPWEMHLSDLHISSEDFANALHEAGVWTCEDARDNSQSVSNAFRSTLLPVLREVQAILKKYRKGEFL